MDFNATGLSVGDVVKVGEGLAPVFSAGPARWYALRVAPQREDQVEAWLKRRGVYSFHPVLMRKVRRMGKVREYARRYLPGYVFARFPGEAVAHRLVGRCGITGALTRLDGSWGVVKPSDLRALHSMRKVDAETAAERRAIRAAERRASTVRAGERALFRAGPFSGLHCEVVELVAEDGAKVRVTLFGREIATHVSSSDLVVIVKGC
ncbi:transcription termination/antitermination protein NusG [Haematobacter missouriensis]|nr:transcription termination/antitermination NusG family protein [Haematobacter missouriensis]